ncbi:MAG: flagellar assembly protein FliH [Burkholderiales bacterium]|nr:flagellar assembly protein FliH [Burkholderiales bacterium]
MTASFKRDGAMADAYKPWQFASLAADARIDGVATAREEAERRAAEAVRSQAYAAGFAAGRADGRAAADAEAAHLKRIAESLAQARHHLEAETAAALLNLAAEIARHMLRAELTINPQAILPAICEATDLAGDAAHPQLYLNPGDVDFVRRHLGEALAVSQWRIIEEAAIEPGGCRVATTDGEVDATLATRWRRAAAMLGVDTAGRRTDLE